MRFHGGRTLLKGARLNQIRPGLGLSCRSCGAPLDEAVAELGMVPVSLSPVPMRAVLRPAAASPLRAMVCGDCRLVQVAGAEAPAREPPSCVRDGFAGVLAARLRLGPMTPVVAYDAAVLSPFHDRDIPARRLQAGSETALRMRDALPPPVLLIAGSALATAGDLHDVLAGVRALLAPGGVATFDIPDILAWLEGNRFDLVSHALANLPSLLVAEMLLGQHGLVPFEVDGVPAAEPWLRLLVRHAEDSTKPVAETVLARRAAERAAGLESSTVYGNAACAVAEARLAVFELLVGARREGRRILGYGADAAAATLAVACGLGPGLLSCTLDPGRGPPGCALPGSGVPIEPLERLDDVPADLVLVLDGTRPETVRAVLAARCRWQGRLALPLPSFRLV